jgi:AcrR family transcriptional regulator
VVPQRPGTEHDPDDPLALGRREQHKRSTRRALEDAALTLFARDGFDATTVEAITERAEVSPRTFFRYFATKDEVLDMGWAARRERILALLLTAPEELGDLGAAVWVLERVAVDLEPDRDRVRLRAVAAATSPALRGRTAEALTAWEVAIGLGLGRRRGLERPDEAASVAAALALGLWGWAMRRWLHPRSGVLLRELVRTGSSHLPGLPPAR